MSKIHFQFSGDRKAACGLIEYRRGSKLSSNDWSKVTCVHCIKNRSKIEPTNIEGAEKYINNNSPTWHDFYIGNNANQHEMSKKDFERHKDISGKIKLGLWPRGSEAYKGQFKVK